MAVKEENILGCDIGGSKINFILWDGKKILKSRVVAAPTIERLRQGIDGFNVRKAGIAIPGIFDAKKLRIIKCPNLPQFNGLNLKNIFREKDIKIDNDVHCFLRAEAALGAGRGYDNVLAVAFGTGIGGAIKIQSSKLKVKSCGSCDCILKGRDGWAGEFGHMIIDRGQDWERLYQKTENKPKEQEKINAVGLANLINIFNPEVIILGGKGAKLPKKEMISQYLLLPKKQMPKIVMAKLGKAANAIGAALLF